MANKPWSSRNRAFRKALKQLRDDKGLRQAELGQRLGKQQSYVSKYESGERKLGYLELLDILDATEHSVQEFHSLYLVKVSEHSTQDAADANLKPDRTAPPTRLKPS